MAENVLGNRRLPFGLILAGILVLGVFAIGLGGGGGGLVTIALSFTYIITAPALNTYQAFITGGNGLPVFTESNFSRLMNNDLLPSPGCLNGCTLTMNPAMYNLTQGVLINKPITLTGSLASVIVSQNLATYRTQCPALGLRELFCVSVSNVVMSGFKVEDVARDRVAGVAGDIITVAATASNGLFQSLTLQNVSSNGILIQGMNHIVTTSTITGFLPQISGGNYGVLMGSTASRIRVFLNTISKFNGSDVAGISSSTGASYISITANDLSQNQFGVLSNWGKALTLNGNTIHNNYAAGILLTTGAFGSNTAGPSTIAENIITDNAQEPTTEAICGSQHCPGIMIRGTRPLWDTVSITGNVIKDTQTIHTQWYGINIVSTNYNNLTITGNSLGISASGITINLGVTPLKSWTIADNPGFNPQPVRGPLTAGATPFTYTNNDGYKEQLELITIGDMTAFTCRGIANIIQVDAISPILNTLDTCVFTYITIAPTYDVLPT